MISAYINYPNPHVTIHANDGCGNVQQQHKQGQLNVLLNRKTLSSELERFESKFYKFGADQSTNDMWLTVDFSDSKFERAVVEYIRQLLASNYSPFARVTVNEHCA
jgi:hypothetical protein